MDEDGRPAHSWRVLLLPFLEQLPLYNQYRFDEPWNGPNNSKLIDRIPLVYQCPSFSKYHGRHKLEAVQTMGLTNYIAITAADAIFSGERATAISDVTDGTSKTLVIADARNHAIHWMQPDDVSENEIVIDLLSATHDHHANHIGGLHVLLADGSVRFISSGMDLKTLHGLVTRNGREILGDF